MPAALNEAFEGNSFIASDLERKEHNLELESPTESEALRLNSTMVRNCVFNNGSYEIGKAFMVDMSNSPWWNYVSTSGESPDTSTPSPSPYGTGVGQFNYDTGNLPSSGSNYVSTSGESPEKSPIWIYGYGKGSFNFDSPFSNYTSSTFESPGYGKRQRSKYPSFSGESTDMNGLKHVRNERANRNLKYDVDHSPGSNYASTSGESPDAQSLKVFPQPYSKARRQLDFDVNYYSGDTSEESPYSSEGSTPTKPSVHSSFRSDSPGSDTNNVFDILDVDELYASLNVQQMLNVRNLFIVNTLVDRVNNLISAANGVSDSRHQATDLLKYILSNDKTIINAQRDDTKSLETAARFHRTAAVSGLHDITHTWSGVLPNRSQRMSGYSNKVFLGGVPWDISEEVIINSFRRFGNIEIEWPGKDQTTQPKGYVYLIFESEKQVTTLLDSCTYNPKNGGTWYYKLSTRRLKAKEVQVIPWTVADSNFSVKGQTQKLEVHKTIFVGALHGMMNAEALYKVMNELFGGVLYAGIDTDKHKYPIGSGRVTFTNEQSYAKAVMAGFVEVRTPKFTKKIQLDPYLEESPCSICTIQTGPYFCRDKNCHRYYCKGCWERYHSQMALPHKPLMRNSKSALISNGNYVVERQERNQRPRRRS